MKENLNTLIFSHIRTNRFKYITASLIIIAGLVTGTIFATNNFLLSENNDLVFANTNTSTTMYSLFLDAFIKNFRPFFIIWLSGKHICLTPLNYIEVSSKGFGIGYTVSYLSLSGGLKGFTLSLVSLVAQNIILLPALLVFSVLQLNISINKQRFNKSATSIKQKKRVTKYNLYSILCIIFIVILCSILDTYLIPNVITPLYQKWF